MKNTPALIAGGGIAGMAVALAMGGRDSLILEKAPAFGDVGAGLQLGPNAVRALQKLGAWDAVAPLAQTPAEIHIWDGLRGKRLKRLPLGAAFEQRFGAPYRVAHRADLHSALMEVVRSRSNIDIKTNAELSSFGLTVDGVAVETNAGVFAGSHLWAADGVHSAIRQKLIAGSAPIDSGARFHRSLLSSFPPVSDVDFGSVNLWMFPGGHVVHYPVGKSARLNVVAIVSGGGTPAHFFAKACGPLQIIVNLLDGASIWPGLYVDPLPAWQFRNITLLGDAAHGTLPYLAQGAAMALEDAAALLATSDDGGLATVLGMRQKRTARLHGQTLAAGRTYHLSGLKSRLRNTAISLSPAALVQNQLSWIYTQD